VGQRKGLNIGRPAADGRPRYVLEIRPKTNTVVVGLVVTVLSAVLPARRAGKVPPLAAMRATAIETAGPGRVRLFWALGFIVLGFVTIGAVIGGASNNFLGLGVLLVFIGTIVIGPSIARPVAMFLGRPAEALRGVTGANGSSERRT